MNTEINITAQDIFERGQLLTLETAKQLIGKKLAITNSEYKYNTPQVRIFTLTGIESEWDLAAKQDMSHTDNGKYATRQDYWATMSETRQEGFKNSLMLVGVSGTADGIHATCDLLDKSWSEPVFFGSDSDRLIMYIELDELTA